MEEPDWKSCTEEELWHYVAWHLEGAGIRSVGGAVVAIYTEGLYRSGDLDLVPDDTDRTRLAEELARIGFEPSRSRYFKHPACPHLFLEFPRGSVEIGEKFPVMHGRGRGGGFPGIGGEAGRGGGLKSAILFRWSVG